MYQYGPGDGGAPTGLGRGATLAGQVGHLPLLEALWSGALLFCGERCNRIELR